MPSSMFVIIDAQFAHVCSSMRIATGVMLCGQQILGQTMEVGGRRQGDSTDLGPICRAVGDPSWAAESSRQGLQAAPFKPAPACFTASGFTRVLVTPQSECFPGFSRFVQKRWHQEMDMSSPTTSFTLFLGVAVCISKGCFKG